MLPLYWSYNRVIQKISKTVLIIETVLISIMIRILIAGALKSYLFWQISSQTANIFPFYCVKITTQ